MESIGIISIIAASMYGFSILHLIYRSNEYKIIIAQSKKSLKYNILVYIISILYVIIGPPITVIVHLFSKSSIEDDSHEIIS